MEGTWFPVMMVAEVVLAGGMMLLSPYIARRGLLFGVYVGEQTWEDAEARALIRAYTVGGVLWVALVLAAGGVAALAWSVPEPAVVIALPLLTVAGFVGLYLRAYFQARRMAAPGGPPPAAALLLPPTEVSPLLPVAAMVIGACCGLAAIVYAATHYADLPARVPTHFGLSGEPDAWRPKSLATVMLSPLLTLVLGVGLGGIALLTARAKRAIRYPAAAVSAEAQFRFRLAMTRYLSAMTILVCGLTTTLAVGAVNVGLGLRPGLPKVTWLFTGLLVLAGVGGSLYIALRYGQGGARLERGAGSAPLTNGLADNRYWILGSFYVNHDDPSIMVEHRFGLGYTLNLGNWKAVTLLVVFVGAVMTIVAVALVTN